MDDRCGGDGQRDDRDDSSWAVTGDGGSTSEKGVSPDFDAKLHAAGVTFDSDDATLLRLIDEAGSLNEAAASLGRSYSRAHKRLQDLEAAFGPLVESKRGGPAGGGSEVTDGARHMLARYERLRTEYSGVTSAPETVFDGRIIERDGELATIETAAGRLRALAPPEVTNVAVTVRSDTVTLHEVDAAPRPSQTSARNRFTGTVIQLDECDAIVTVSLDVGSETPLKALVTAESKRELDLKNGLAVVASFKTTATRASPRR